MVCAPCTKATALGLAGIFEQRQGLVWRRSEYDLVERADFSRCHVYRHSTLVALHLGYVGIGVHHTLEALDDSTKIVPGPADQAHPHLRVLEGAQHRDREARGHLPYPFVGDRVGVGGEQCGPAICVRIGEQIPERETVERGLGQGGAPVEADLLACGARADR